VSTGESKDSEQAPGTPSEFAEVTPSPDPGPEPGATYIIRKQPLWSFFLTPVAVLMGAALIGGAILMTGDEDGGSDGNSAAVGGLPSSSGSPGAGLPAIATPATLLSTFNGYAQSIGMDVDQFQQCLTNPAHEQVIRGDLQEGTSLGVSGTPTFFINNKKIVGAQPAAIFDEIIRLELEGSPTAVTEYSPNIQALAAANPPRFEIVTNQPDLNGAAIEGPENPRLIIAEYSDFQCPFCKNWVDQTLPGLRQNWMAQGVGIAFLHFPLTQIHPNAGNASVAAICAGEQDRFWEMHDLLFARQTEWQNLAQ
jgi:protein-disulfide isomerase